MLKESWRIYFWKEENKGSRKSETKLRRQNKSVSRVVVKGNPDTIAVEQACRATPPEGMGAQKAPDRPYKGMDDAFRIPDVLDALRKGLFV